MYDIIKHTHSYWAYLVLAILIIAVINAIFGLISKKEYSAKDLRIALFGLIIAHIQFLIGLVLYFVSPYFEMWSHGGVMGDAAKRLYLVEHPAINIITIVLITVGFSKHKKKDSSASKFKTIFIFYLIGLILLLSRIPWDVWPNW